MNSKKKIARTAGILYLILAISAPIAFMYIPFYLIVSGDATTTANNLFYGL